MAFLTGYKTYIIAALMALIALVHLFTGDMGLTEFLNSPDLLVLLNGIGLGTLRAAVKKQ